MFRLNRLTDGLVRREVSGWCLKLHCCTPGLVRTSAESTPYKGTTSPITIEPLLLLLLLLLIMWGFNELYFLHWVTSVVRYVYHTVSLQWSRSPAIHTFPTPHIVRMTKAYCMHTTCHGNRQGRKRYSSIHSSLTSLVNKDEWLGHSWAALHPWKEHPVPIRKEVELSQHLCGHCKDEKKFCTCWELNPKSTVI